MIQKISFLDSSVNCVDCQGCTHNVADSSIINKINEIIDLLNAIVVDVDGTKCIDGSKAPADPYAEQRKWIGCLVEYGNADDGFRYGILTNIEARYSAYPFEIDNGRDATADCWLPSKTIFYKGGDNE